MADFTETFATSDFSVWDKLSLDLFLGCMHATYIANLPSNTFSPAFFNIKLIHQSLYMCDPVAESNSRF